MLHLVAGRVGAAGYDPHYFPTLAAVEREHYWFASRREVVRDALRAAVPDLAHRALFDLGCGTGGLLRFLGDSGIALAGACDAYPESLAIVRRLVAAPLVLVDEGRFPPLGPGYRLLSLFDVLEHIDDDTGTLRHVFSVLEPGGVLVLTVPAHPFLFDEMDELAHHRRRYRRSELGQKLRGAGFEVRRLTHFMAPLVPLVVVRWLVRAASRGRRSAERRRNGASCRPGAQRPDARRARARTAPGARRPAAVSAPRSSRSPRAPGDRQGRCKIRSMTARTLDGAEIARQIKDELRGRLAGLAAAGIRPGLGVILVGDDPASAVYVRSKTRTCEELGLFHETRRLAGERDDRGGARGGRATTTAGARSTGSWCSCPCRGRWTPRASSTASFRTRTWTGSHPENVGRLVQKRPRFVPCTPAGIMEMLTRSGIEVAGRRAVVLGRSDIVGKPMALLLMHADATVTRLPLAHARTSPPSRARPTSWWRRSGRRAWCAPSTSSPAPWSSTWA